jgi:phosphatidate cytidylyltransferase
LYEYVRLIAPRYNLQRGWTFLLFSVGIPLVVHWYGESALAPAVLVTFAVLSLALVGTGQPVNAVLGLGVAFLGIVYVPLLSSFLLLVRGLPDGMAGSSAFGGKWLILLFATIWSCDTAAYFVGKSLGKHKLAPVISPNKTIEGAVGGIIGGFAAAYLCQGTFFREALPKDALVVGMVVGVIGQLGDLVESMLKRDAQVKDSSAIIPGHGGVLDRFDSLLFTLPCIYYYLKYFVYR